MLVGGLGGGPPAGQTPGGQSDPTGPGTTPSPTAPAGESALLVVLHFSALVARGVCVQVHI
jgi:hypothetical protein